MKKVLITGANGFLGSNLCKKLISRGFDVSVLVRKNSDLSDLEGLNLKYHYGDILDTNSLNQALQNQDYVLHLAGLISYKRWERDKLYQVNVVGTKNVLESCIQNRIQKLLFLSSVVTIGASFNPEILNESSPYKVKNLDFGYFETKKEAEELVLAAARKNQIFAYAINPSTIYGPADAKKGSRNNQIKVAQGKMSFYTRGGVNVISVDDVTEGLILSLDRAQSGERYVFCNENLTIKELFKVIAKEAGQAAPSTEVPSLILRGFSRICDLFKFGMSRDRAYTATMYHWFSGEKAKNELGFIPKTSSEDAIKQSVQWMKDHKYL